MSLYIFSFCFQSKSWNKDNRTKPDPLFLAGNPLGPSPILCHQVTLSSLAEFASISLLSIFPWRNTACAASSWSVNRRLGWHHQHLFLHLGLFLSDVSQIFHKPVHAPPSHKLLGQRTCHPSALREESAIAIWVLNNSVSMAAEKGHFYLWSLKGRGGIGKFLLEKKSCSPTFFSLLWRMTAWDKKWNFPSNRILRQGSQICFQSS